MKLSKICFRVASRLVQVESSGALGVRSQREGSSGETTFQAATFYLHAVECKNTFEKSPVLVFFYHSTAYLLVGGVLRMIVANFAIPSTIRSPLVGLPAFGP